MIPSMIAEAASGSDDLVGEIRRFFDEGGTFMVLLAVTSVVGLAAVVFKFLSLARSRILPEPLERQVARFEAAVGDGAAEAVLQEFEKGGSALARLGALAVRMRGRSLVEITEAVQAQARLEIVRMHAGMVVIDVVISVAPMLGLLGTASGLVVVFSGLQSDTDWLVISGGIGRALNTTIVGMVIAVPAIIAQGFFQRRIDTFAARLEVLLTQLAEVCARASGGKSGN